MENKNVMLPHDHAERVERARLSIEGLSIGDALGERFFYGSQVEELIRARVLLHPVPWRYTDDTAMALSVFEVLSQLGRIETTALAKQFASRYRHDPRRGYGGAARHILEAISSGTPWETASSRAFSGEGSMGNGGAMRVAPVGAYFADNLDLAVENAAASAMVTHAHPDGQAGAIAVAVAAATAHQMRLAGELSPAKLFETVLDRTPYGPTWEGLVKASELPADSDVQRAVAILGNGSHVISSDTVPFAIWCAARHLSDFETAFWTTVSGLGDRDTTCAIVGGIVAMSAGQGSIPAAWIASREALDLEQQTR